MPNDIYSSVKLIGTQEVVKQARELVSSENNPFDFEKILPTPKDLSRNEEYNWRIDNWGTKNNSYDHEFCEDDTYHFCTAWAPPIEVIKKLTELVLGLTIELFYEDSDGSRHTLFFADGEQIPMIGKSEFEAFKSDEECVLHIVRVAIEFARQVEDDTSVTATTAREDLANIVMRYLKENTVPHHDIDEHIAEYLKSGNQ